MPGSAVPAGAPLTRRQIREAERARRTVTWSVHPPAVQDFPADREDATAPQQSSHLLAEPGTAVSLAARPDHGSAAGTAGAEPVTADAEKAAGATPATPATAESVTDAEAGEQLGETAPADATPTEVLPVGVRRRDLRDPRPARPVRRPHRLHAARAVTLGALGLLTIGGPITGGLQHEDAQAAAAAPVVEVQPSVLATLDAGIGAAALKTSAPTSLLADPGADGRAQLQQASRANARQALPPEALTGASGTAAGAVEPEPERPAVVTPLPAGTYRKTSGYGERSYPIAGMHTGTDFAAPLGTPVRAAADGVVTYVGPGKDGRSSMLITIEHEVDGQKVWTWYNHMYSDGLKAEVGQEVRAGDVIAEVGDNGRSTGPHLHFEVHLDEELNTTEPLAWLGAHGAEA
ncbi:M23 family metallopeptidase [Georgenia sp. TF02-10]|uniref:M23 family metallopeptidase n=1 Tax=Georgenia sp. TF02-10 TaxID=2917725 RepID=UPI001FA811B9|nr:M23 family metallopeptidase [Georgenia sp. TF02-10]UNX55215.1 M23 family metallopeptidase [Georgenia sp. TF02-10]